MGGARPNSGRGGGGSYRPPVEEKSVAAPQPVVQQEAPRYTEPQQDESRVDPARFQRQQEELYQRALDTQREQQAAAQREMDNQNAMYSQNILNNAPQSMQQLRSAGSLTNNLNNTGPQGMPTSPSRFSRRSTKGKRA